ncbi:sulfurtransferase [Ligilactobacillus pabuli]|uniref:Sulfurtransferase n=1 Tax=Ligilactobacillus pabuli TaxID=2886039 RepID=A0ABQ5JFY0_9LACO|nr:rhodanese-like domain-containing protein [Ligilactobacillus pabuli]GKS80915.1 sulfurtransferase [Ligilactobacillus pabuli]
MFVLGDLGVMFWIDVVLVLILVWLFGGQFYTYFMGKKYATILKNDDFKEGMHKAQIIDVREANDFKKKHILGARNMPFSQFKLYKDSLRKDMPIYLYDDTKTVAPRMASKLHKNGYTDIYILKSGLDKWDGKTKGTKKA